MATVARQILGIKFRLVEITQLLNLFLFRNNFLLVNYFGWLVGWLVNYLDHIDV